MGIFGDPTKAEVRHSSYGGKTSQEIVDDMQKSSPAPDKADYSNPPHPSASTAPKAPGPSIHPTAKGVYGAPIQAPILK